MKRTLKILIIVAFLIAPLFIFAQEPPTPGDVPPDGSEVPAGAPIGNGTFILLTLAAAYGLRKVYELRVVKEEVTE